MSVKPLSRLRLNELQTVVENTLKICEGIPELARPIAAIKTLFAEFKLGMNKAAVTSERAVYDDKRDHAFSGFKAQLRADLMYPGYDEAAIKILLALKAVVAQHDNNLVDMRYDEQTAALENFLKDARAISLGPFADTQLLRWIELIEQENSAFKRVSEEWVKNNVNFSQVESATKQAPRLRKQLDNLVSMLALNVNYYPEDENLKQAYHQVNQLGVAF